jgi:hypothetical protein
MHRTQIIELSPLKMTDFIGVLHHTTCWGQQKIDTALTNLAGRRKSNEVMGGCWGEEKSNLKLGETNRHTDNQNNLKEMKRSDSKLK